jgi:hypothetical protein
MAPISDYMEAQIWGPVTISDVNHFIVNCDEGKNPDTNAPMGKISDAGLQELEKLNLPIFSCQEDKVSGRLIHIQEGKQIFFQHSKTAPDRMDDFRGSQRNPGESQSAE